MSQHEQSFCCRLLLGTRGGELGDQKLHQVYRQDLVGFSGIGGGSSYALAGPPGWYNEDVQGALTPNPDFFITALQRRLVGSKRFEVKGDDEDKILHAACSKNEGVVLSFTNVLNETSALTSIMTEN